ncbi:hypothetical protein NZD88_20990 [Chryseobacterium antibioticum]|uniref:DUF6876 domain-containing protein n=1 Tax=Chryseobacterium pyrolae TaxID=2987481 RepID=A0ABT2IN10_9FLAO|nr:DUF6876 family protein [Chryseobacterium pyrolae]MCT2410040.1 hypothetical protein [Chryseobacterium pyrolae]
MKDEQQSANEFYGHYTGTERYYPLDGVLLTDGVFEIAGEEECFWFLQTITLNQKKLANEPFQTWKLKRLKDNQFEIVATDGNENVIFEEIIPFSDFFFKEFTIWVENGVLLLPSER